MKSFKAYLESSALSLMPQNPNMSFEEFMQTLVGETIKTILDKSSYVNLYYNNKYGFRDTGSSDKNVKDFANALVNFVNKDVTKHRPSVREYETPEFREKNNYAEYQELDQQRRSIFRQMIGKSDEERRELRKQQEAISDAVTDTQYYKAMRAVEKGYDEAVDNYHNTPLSASDLSDDGSSQYKDLKRAYNAIFGDVALDDDNVIDV